MVNSEIQNIQEDYMTKMEHIFQIKKLVSGQMSKIIIHYLFR